MGHISQLRITHTSTCTVLTVSTKWEPLEAGGWTESCWVPSLGKGALPRICLRCISYSTRLFIMHHPRKSWFWHIAQAQFIQLLNVGCCRSQSLLGVVVFYCNCILLQSTSNDILSAWILILCQKNNLICDDIAQCYSPNLANNNKEDDDNKILRR
jgi:hypothetical protein